ncbi:ABC transporter permease/substrate binding protein [Streptomyces longwoodensis]|uniref:ABC transporter permease/substrate binding protein n=1 Tax=Streptomyces longwoodensis TaxID=68231 RepID=UPI0033F65D65
MPRLHLGDWVDSGVDWLVAHLSWLFDAVKAVVEGMYDGIDAVPTAPQPLPLAGILAVLAWWLRGLVAGVLSFAGFALIDSLDLWDQAMSTLSLVLVATLIALAVSLPLGTRAARSRAVSATVKPVLDLLQTMPSMVLLIPAILFFGMGVPAGVVATLIFALAPGVRMTELGVRQVDAELVEAAEAFGTTRRDTLLRVQLPPALPTIMAGVNQVIMLGLSMVVIAGMVGTGGLGGAVNEAIGRLDIGLGFEAGLGIVVLAIYLDRLTGALGTRLSPLGRRAAAKARTTAWSHRPRPAVAVACVAALALVAGGLGVFGGPAGTAGATGEDVGRGKEVKLGYIPWDEGIASTYLWKEILEQRGFKVTTTQYAAGPLYTGLATGQLDVQTDAWLPTTHAEYGQKYGKRLDEPAMLAELKRAYAKKQPVLVTLWSPYWAYAQYGLKKLEEPRGARGKGDGVHTVARQGFAEDNPGAARWLKAFSMTERQLTDLEARIQQAGQGKEQDAARAWLADHPGLLDKWAPADGGAAGTKAAADSGAAG